MALLDQSYEALKSSVYQSLALQTRRKPYLDAVSLALGLQPLTELSIKAGSGTVTGTASGEYLFRHTANDTLNENDGADWLSGGAGNDSLYGGNGNDTLDDATRSDILYRGQGNDTYVFNLGNGADTIVETHGIPAATPWHSAPASHFGGRHRYRDGGQAVFL